MAAFLLRFGAFFVAWLLGCFALGAVATSTGKLDRDHDAVWLRDSHQRTREHFGAVFVIALFTYAIFLVGMAAVEFVEFAAIKAIGWGKFARFNYLASLLGYVVIASIVSWFGMAIPFVIRGNVGVWGAIKKSCSIHGYETFLFLLIIESVIGSYLGWYATHWALWFAVPVPLKYSWWYSWLLILVGALSSAAVQPPMFIGFSLLAEEHSTSASTPDA